MLSINAFDLLQKTLRPLKDMVDRQEWDPFMEQWADEACAKLMDVPDTQIRLLAGYFRIPGAETASKEQLCKALAPHYTKTPASRRKRKQEELVVVEDVRSFPRLKQQASEIHEALRKKPRHAESISGITKDFASVAPFLPLDDLLVVWKMQTPDAAISKEELHARLERFQKDHPDFSTGRPGIPEKNLENLIAYNLMEDYALSIFPFTLKGPEGREMITSRLAEWVEVVGDATYAVPAKAWVDEIAATLAESSALLRYPQMIPEDLTMQSPAPEELQRVLQNTNLYQNIQQQWQGATDTVKVVSQILHRLGQHYGYPALFCTETDAFQFASNLSPTIKTVQDWAISFGQEFNFPDVEYIPYTSPPNIEINLPDIVGVVTVRNPLYTLSTTMLPQGCEEK